MTPIWGPIFFTEEDYYPSSIYLLSIDLFHEYLKNTLEVPWNKCTNERSPKIIHAKWDKTIGNEMSKSYQEADQLKKTYNTCYQTY